MRCVPLPSRPPWLHSCRSGSCRPGRKVPQTPGLLSTFATQRVQMQAEPSAVANILDGTNTGTERKPLSGVTAKTRRGAAWLSSNESVLRVSALQLEMFSRILVGLSQKVVPSSKLFVEGSSN
eukprot:45421-Pyramimonas_sp.AAC.1